MISDKVKELIEFYSTEINHNLWEALYEVFLSIQDLDYQYIGEFTECMIKAGINPLEYLDDIPSAYLYATNVQKAVIDDPIKTVKSWAYSNCTHLNYVFLSDSVEYVDDNAFAYCGKIAKVVIMNPSTYIESFAFYDSEIDTVIFNGTKEEWESSNNHYMHPKHIECTDGVYR